MPPAGDGPAGEPGPTGAAPAPKPAATGRPGTGANLALNRTVRVSGSEGSAWPAAEAVDGDTTTRWSSAFAENQWIAVDLGDTWAVTQVGIVWERSYAETYHIDVSTNGTTWRTVRSGIQGAEGRATHQLTGVPARWVRIWADTRHQPKYGISLYELTVR